MATAKTKRKTGIFRNAALASLAAAAIFFAVQPVVAGPITGGSGNQPFTKLGVYQGVIAVVPADGSAVMEIGNAGRDVASTGDIYLRPGSLDTGAVNYAKFYKDGLVTSLNIPGKIETVGDVKGGRLCIGADCRNVWPGGGAGSQNLQQVLATGNTSTTSIILNNTAPLTANYLTLTAAVPASIEGGEMTIQKGTGGTLDWRIDSNDKYFRIFNDNFERLTIDSTNGKVNIPGELTVGSLCLSGVCNSSWPPGGATPTLQQVLTAGNISGMPVSLGGPTNVWPQAEIVVMRGISPASYGGNVLDTVDTYNNNAAGSAIYAQQENSQGFAGYFSGASKMVGAGRSGATLEVVNNNNNVLNKGTAITANGSNEGSGLWANGPAAIEAQGGNATTGQTTYGLYVQQGTGAGGNNYAASFQGRVLRNGLRVGIVDIAAGGGSCKTLCEGQSMTCQVVWTQPAENVSATETSCTSTTNTRICLCS